MIENEYSFICFMVFRVQQNILANTKIVTFIGMVNSYRFYDR